MRTFVTTDIFGRRLGLIAFRPGRNSNLEGDEEWSTVA
jgi:hypothetical protein